MAVSNFCLRYSARSSRVQSLKAAHNVGEKCQEGGENKRLYDFLSQRQMALAFMPPPPLTVDRTVKLIWNWVKDIPGYVDSVPSELIKRQAESRVFVAVVTNSIEK